MVREDIREEKYGELLIQETPLLRKIGDSKEVMNKGKALP